MPSSRQLLRRSEKRADQTTLVVDAGDAFQGLPISNSTKGEARAKILNEMGYDAMAVGNHEFDFGLDEVKKYKEILNFPLLSSNTYVMVLVYLKQQQLLIRTRMLKVMSLSSSV